MWGNALVTVCAANKSKNAAADIVNLQTCLTVKLLPEPSTLPRGMAVRPKFFFFSLVSKTVLSDFVSYTANPLYFFGIHFVLLFDRMYVFQIHSKTLLHFIIVINRCYGQ